MKRVLIYIGIISLLSFAGLGQTSVQSINLGTTANDGTGDTIRSAFGKVNANFTALVTAINTRFPLSFSGLTCTVGAGNITFDDGNTLSFAGGNITLFANFTNYVVLNYATGKLHVLYRFLGGGGEHLLARIVTGSTTYTTIWQNTDFTAMPTRIAGAKRRLFANPASFIVAGLGDSLTEASGTGTMWKDLLFNSSFASSGYAVSNVASVTFKNFAQGGVNADFGAIVVSRAAQSFGFPYQGYGGHGDAIDFSGVASGSAAKTFTPLTGLSSFWTVKPDLVTVAFGVNASLSGYGTYSSQDMEVIARRLTEQDVPIIWLTEGDFSGSAASCGYIATNVFTLANSIGGAIADTAAYEDEVNRRGTSTYVDTVHQNQAGWNAWAEAVLGVLNTNAQRPMTIAVHPNRVIDPATSTEAPYQGTAMTFVGGTVFSAGSGVTQVSPISGYIPNWFAEPKAQSVPSGNYVDYYHSCWTSAQLVFEKGVGSNGQGANSFGGNSAWIDAGGTEHQMRTFSFTDDNNGAGNPLFPRVGLLDLASITQVIPAITQLGSSGSTLVMGGSPMNWNHGAIRVKITSGNALILGVAFRGPRHRKISLRGDPAWVLSSNVTDDTADPNGWYPHSLANDTLGDSVGAKFRGVIQLLIKTSTAGGQLKFYGDGRALLGGSAFDSYSTGNEPFIFQYGPGLASGSDIGRISGTGQLEVLYSGNNGSRTSAAAGKHGINIIDAVEIY